MNAPSEPSLDDVRFGLLDLATEDVYALVEFRDTWPRDLVIAALLDLYRGGLLVIAPEGEMDAVASADCDPAQVEVSVREPSAWEPTAQGRYLSIAATPVGHAEYQRLSAARSGPL